VSPRQDLSTVSCTEQSGFLRSTFDRACRHIDRRELVILPESRETGAILPTPAEFPGLRLCWQETWSLDQILQPFERPFSGRCHCLGEIFLNHRWNHFSIHPAASIDSPTYGHTLALVHPSENT